MAPTGPGQTFCGVVAFIAALAFAGGMASNGIQVASPHVFCKPPRMPLWCHSVGFLVSTRTLTVLSDRLGGVAERAASVLWGFSLLFVRGPPQFGAALPCRASAAFPRGCAMAPR